MRLALSVLVLVLAGCADKTAILVEVTSSDLAVPADVDALRFEATSEAGRRVDTTFALEGSWPHTLAILPGPGDDGALAITVTGLREGRFRVRRVVSAAFERGATRRVLVVLSRDCLDVSCDPGVDCLGGTCRGGQLDGGTDGGPLDGGGRDAGMRDGGMRDAGSRDGGMLDGGARDGGIDGGVRDAGTDAGRRDAGRDGGRDAGPPDTGVALDSGPTPIACVREPAMCRGALVISEVAPAGAGGASDEFVEIHNRSASTVDAGGLEIRYAAQSTSVPALRGTLPLGTLIHPGRYFLAASVDYVGAVVPDLPASWSATQGFSSDRGSVLLLAGGTAIDVVGWRRAGEPQIPMSEGMPVPYASASELAGGASFERKAVATSTASSMSSGGADAARGNGFDSEDNATDFVTRPSREPQSSVSPAEMP